MDQVLSTDRGRLGDLKVPSAPQGVVVVTSEGDLLTDGVVTETLNNAHFATLQLDGDPSSRPVSATGADVRRLTERVLAAADWISGHPDLSGLPIGIFGARAGGGAALAAAARRPETFRAVVSRDGRPHVAGSVLEGVLAATLLIADGYDHGSVAFNQEAMTRVRGIAELEIMAGTAPGFDEPGARVHVARLARRWFARFLP